jgi:hypothetical protein
MGESTHRISTGNLPENPSKPSRKGSWVPQGQRAARRDECKGCGQSKPPEDFSKFYSKDLSLDADEEAQFLCNYCVTYGPPLSDPLAKLNVSERHGMLILSSGGTVADAARRIGISKEKLRDSLSGREKSLYREAFQRMLVAEGLGPDAVMGALTRAITGKKMQYNAATLEFEAHDDYAAQMRATDMLVKLLDLKPPQELARNVDQAGSNAGVVVNIQTNVGDGATVRQDEYEVVGIVEDE